MPNDARSCLVVPAALLFLWASTSLAYATEVCLVCHQDESLSLDRNGRAVSLFVDAHKFQASVHAGLDCTDCHLDFDPESIPHDGGTRVNCGNCHGEIAESHSFHPQMAGAEWGMDDPSTSCGSCHDDHEIRPPTSEGARFHPSRQVQSCGECHSYVSERFRGSEHGMALAEGAEYAPACLSCHRKPISPAWRVEGVAGVKVTQEKVCLSCHLDDPQVRARMAPEAGFIAAYEKSVHGAALLSGNGAAANCVDCHGSHEMKHAVDPSARTSKVHIPETCSQCHPAIAEEYAGSVHAEALKRGNMSAPACTDCHSEHDILFHTDPRSPVEASNVSAQVCSPCHSSLQFSRKYGIASDRFETFADSYHGLAIQGGAVGVANCASCHSAHDIKRSSHPDSTVNKENLAVTCGKCHPGANQRFAVGTIHVTNGEAESPILFWIAYLYLGMIWVVVGGMVLHNLLDFIKRGRKRLRRRAAAGGEEEREGRLYLRMTLNERIQHGLLMSSFTVLVITGFMLRYPEAGWVQLIRQLSDHAFELRSLAHRTAGVVMLLSGFMHLYNVIFTARGRQFVRDIFPRVSDGLDAVKLQIYNLGFSREAPRFDRFGYVEKMEYWAVVWGTVIMVATGAIMWFENTSISWLTKLGWDIARTVHFYEAWLATLAIAVWHFYAVIFNPDIYPMSTVWITGKLSEEEMREEHPLELEKIQEAERETGTHFATKKVVGSKSD